MRPLHLSEIRNLRDLAGLVEEGAVQLVSTGRKPVEQATTFTKVPEPGSFQPVATETVIPPVGRPKRQAVPMQIPVSSPAADLRRIVSVFSRPMVTGATGSLLAEGEGGEYLVVFTKPNLFEEAAPGVRWEVVSGSRVARSVAGGQFDGVIIDPNSPDSIELSRRQLIELFR